MLWRACCLVHGFAGAAATHERGETNEQVSRHDRQSGRKQVRRGVSKRKTKKGVEETEGRIIVA